MDGFNSHLTVSLVFSLALLILLPTSTEAQICTIPSPVDIRENNMVGEVVATIPTQSDVVVSFMDPPGADYPFAINGNNLTAVTVLDYEQSSTHQVRITCTQTTTGATLSNVIVVIVINENDNPPVFAQNPYNVNVNEMSAIGTTVGRFAATDLDGQSALQYTLSDSNYFRLKSPTTPELIVNATLNYDNVKNVELVLTVHDGPFPLAEYTTSTATTTILVTIVDVDNRPPWFQPCHEHNINGLRICKSGGYTGNVFLNEQKDGALPLTPGPLYAIDGDSGINDEITYSIISGNGDALFGINSNTGNITMLKPADVLGPITLTVLAAQKTNSFQFDTTTITITINSKSEHPPQFPSALYEGTVRGAGSMVMALDMITPLQVLATDQDYAAVGGINPDIAYSVEGSSDFFIAGGYLFMTKALPDSTVSFKVVAKDTKNSESATTDLSVKVESGLTTTPQTSTSINTKPGVSTGTTTSNPSGSTASGITTTKPTAPTGTTTSNPSGSTASGITTTKTTASTGTTTSTPSGSTASGITTTKTTASIGTATNTSSGSTASGITTTKPTAPTGTATNTPSGSTASGNTAPKTTASTNTTHTETDTTGRYGVGDMAALGVTLGVLLFIALVVIGVLLYKMRRRNTDWRKLYEASVFRSSLGQVSGDHKEGIQYTNEAFQKDEDGGSVGSGGPDKEPIKSSTEPLKSSWDIPSKEAIVMSSERLHNILPDDTSEAGSDKVENDKEVKPILTKERRVEEGYKSVWFKEDIDPNAKEEVVIIPDSREDDSEEEDEEPSTSTRDDDEDSNSPVKTPKVLFADSDLDSGLGVRIEDPADDYDEVLNIDL